jgi:hypothetical protein
MCYIVQYRVRMCYIVQYGVRMCYIVQYGVRTCYIAQLYCSMHMVTTGAQPALLIRLSIASGVDILGI